MGLKMLVAYTGSVAWLMGTSDGTEWGALAPVTGVVGMIVAYTWPIVKPLLGLSYLTKYQKCLASHVLMVYLFIFFMAHMALGDMGAATFDLAFVILVALQKMSCGSAAPAKK